MSHCDLCEMVGLVNWDGGGEEEREAIYLPSLPADSLTVVICCGPIHLRCSVCMAEFSLGVQWNPC